MYKRNLFFHFCNDIYKEKMTVEERAELMTDLYADLGYEDYDLINDKGWLCIDIEKAINELKEADESDN